MKKNPKFAFKHVQMKKEGSQNFCFDAQSSVGKTKHDIKSKELLH